MGDERLEQRSAGVVADAVGVEADLHVREGCCAYDHSVWLETTCETTYGIAVPSGRGRGGEPPGKAATRVASPMNFE